MVVKSHEILKNRKRAIFWSHNWSRSGSIKKNTSSEAREKNNCKKLDLNHDKTVFKPRLSNKDIDDPSGGRNGLFVKKLRLIDCARLAESVWVPAITDRCRSPELGVILTKLRELWEPKFQITTETSFSLFAPKIWTCDHSWNSWIGEFWRNVSPGVTVNFLIDYCESFMQVSNNLELKTGKWTTWSGNKLFHLDNFRWLIGC